MNVKFSLSEMITDMSPITIVHVGASILPGHSEPYSPLVAAGRAHVIAFEPDRAERAKMKSEFTKGYTILPHFVGAGGPATFFETNMPYTGSLLEPNTAVLEKFNFLSELVQLKKTHPVITHRLDDIPEVMDVDYLKIDVQGAELSVFEGGAEVLSSCSLIETEVEFVPLYKDQPLFADIDCHLRKSGFSFHTFRNERGRYFRPLAAKDPGARMNQLLWADAVYVREMMNLERLETEKLAKLAVLLHDLYGSADLAMAALVELDARAGGDRAKHYRRRLQTA